MISALSRKLSIISPDLLVIGGGPGGYVATIRAAQLGLKTVCVEKEQLMGGTCLREGCIPSKFLLNVSHKLHEANTEFSKIGLKVPGKVTYDMKTVQTKKNGVISGLSKGIELLIKKNGAELIHGSAFINGPNSVTVSTENGPVSIAPKRILLATGSKLWYPKAFPVDEKVVVTSRGALEWQDTPKSLCVIGGGVIGLELGSVWSTLGSKVTIVDLANTVGGPGIEPEAAQLITRVLKRRGMDFELGKAVESLTKTPEGVEVVVGGKKIMAERALVSVGRQPNLTGFGLENLGIKMTQRGLVDVNERLETSLPNVFAIGDIVPGPQLAHKAEEEGAAAVEMMVGKHASIDHGVIPSVIYTSPEIASVGLMQHEAKQKGIKVKVSKFPYMANSRARAIGETEGYVKFVCSENNTVLGMSVVGSNAGEAIMEGAIAIKNKLNIKAIADTCHPHPTLSEAVVEAAKGIVDKPIHI